MVSESVVTILQLKMCSWKQEMNSSLLVYQKVLCLCCLLPEPSPSVAGIDPTAALFFSVQPRASHSLTSPYNTHLTLGSKMYCSWCNPTKRTCQVPDNMSSTRGLHTCSQSRIRCWRLIQRCCGFYLSGEYLTSRFCTRSFINWPV